MANLEKVAAPHYHVAHVNYINDCNNRKYLKANTSVTGKLILIIENKYHKY